MTKKLRDNFWFWLSTAISAVSLWVAVFVYCEIKYREIDALYVKVEKQLQLQIELKEAQLRYIEQHCGDCVEH